MFLINGREHQVDAILTAKGPVVVTGILGTGFIAEPGNGIWGTAMFRFNDDYISVTLGGKNAIDMCIHANQDVYGVVIDGRPMLREKHTAKPIVFDEVTVSLKVDDNKFDLTTKFDVQPQPCVALPGSPYYQHVLLHNRQFKIDQLDITAGIELVVWLAGDFNFITDVKLFDVRGSFGDIDIDSKALSVGATKFQVNKAGSDIPSVVEIDDRYTVIIPHTYITKFNHHPEQCGEWFPYNGWRYKDLYDIKLKTGEVLKEYYPNGGSFFSTGRDKQTRVVGKERVLDEEVDEIRLLPADEITGYTFSDRIKRDVDMFRGAAPVKGVGLNGEVCYGLQYTTRYDRPCTIAIDHMSWDFGFDFTKQSSLVNYGIPLELVAAYGQINNHHYIWDMMVRHIFGSVDYCRNSFGPADWADEAMDEIVAEVNALSRSAHIDSADLLPIAKAMGELRTRIFKQLSVRGVPAQKREPAPKKKREKKSKAKGPAKQPVKLTPKSLRKQAKRERRIARELDHAKNSNV